MTEEEALVEIPSKLFLRFHRKTQADPLGTLTHHGDCETYRVKICTCGLLHDLRPVKNANKIYPKFDEELGQHEQAIEKLFHQE